jgi:hypothetical protein
MTQPGVQQSAVNPSTSQQAATSTIYGTRYDPNQKQFYIGGTPTKLGPFIGGLHNSSGNGEFIQNDELFELVNLEVDLDGSLVNRPQINNMTITGINADSISFIGTYLPSDGRKFIVANVPAEGKVVLIDVNTGIANTWSAPGVTSVCCIQYANKLFVIADTASVNPGGFFDAPTSSTITWTAAPTMPRGQAVAQYRERVWIACGLSATSNTSRFFFCSVGDPTIWAGTDYVDVVPGNGQKLVSLSRLGNDLVLFKEHSTHKFTYTSDPRKAELTEIDATIGCPAINCVVVYNNNTIYILHDNAVYELFQYNYTRITALINMDQVTDATMYAKDQYGLTIHRDRLFLRYFNSLYVYALRIKRWSSWETTKKFSKLVVIPSTTVGLDTAYAHSASFSNPGKGYFFQDNRKTLDSGIIPADPVNERFKGRIVTKTYDFDVPHTFKVVFWYGIALATSGLFTVTMTIPNASKNLTWAEAQALYGSWGAAEEAGVKWSNSSDIDIVKVITPALGGYARKFIKLPKKARFRQIKFTMEFDIISNGGIADATLRIYDLTVFLKQKQVVSKETS